ncbi:MAG: energy-coupling factor ABC transporter permease [Thiocapsa sp.]|nr:energy-coupling factor ABC transporter permease [Thiocapsa sp.]MCG6986206.1 energy-coupling factor ABC transporter permease [Thiocapsa sp.]
MGFLAGALSFGLSALLVVGSLALSGSELRAAAQLILIAQFPVLLVEGAVTAAILRLLLKVRPGLIQVSTRQRVVPAERPQEA